MRALVQDAYGSPDVLEVAAVPMPRPGPGQVRIRVAAASVNARDWHIMRGEPRLARLLDRTVFGRSAPRLAIRGTDFAGTVDAVGAGVTRWQPGDPVFGEADAALAEHVVAAQELVAPVPAGASFTQAAALPLAANTALLCLRAGDPTPGARLLINGAILEPRQRPPPRPGLRLLPRHRRPVPAGPAAAERMVIWQGRFWSPDTPDTDGWGRPYTGGGVYDAGDATGGHFDHVHLSIDA